MDGQGLASMMGMDTTKEALYKGAMDDVPAEIQETQEPIRVSEGEFVFSVPAIIGLGEGDYNRGLQMLETIHNEMFSMGEAMAGEMGLGAIYNE